MKISDISRKFQFTWPCHLPLALKPSLLVGVAAIIIGGVTVAGGSSHEAKMKDLIHLKAARNPATLFKTATWYEAFNQEDTHPLSKYGTVLFGRKCGQKVCTLTFDDGPHPLYTPRLVETLKQLHVPATFFVIGKEVDRFPYLIQLERENGFEIGNHSYSHVTLTHLNRQNLLTELKACNMAIENAGGAAPNYCRPPGGDVNWETVRAAQTCGMTVALWSDDPGDYAIKSPAVIAKDVIKKLGDNSIILLHDGNNATIDALPEIVRWARAHGYRFVPLHDMPITRI